MEESVATAGKLMLPGLTLSSGDGSTQQTVPEMEPASAGSALSPLKKNIKPPGSSDVFETITAGAIKEISVVFSKFARVLNDQAAADASRMKELEGILAEARGLESYLRERKHHLRELLGAISDKLQG